jgi:ubiquinone/menaquinone biosynthesis C-methylase UbiE
MTRFLTTLLMLVPAFAVGQDKPASDRKDGRYEWKAKHDPNGIGKFYMGREIAYVMGHSAASWLERPEREEEENPKKLLELLKLKDGDVVADIGAGSGYYAFRLARLVAPKGKVLAVDIQKEMLDIIRDRSRKEGVTNVEPVQGEEADPKLKDESVDVILLVDVYHEFAFPYEMTAKMVKGLKPGGRLVFVEFRLEDEKVPIKLVHKMSERQVLKEMAEFKELKHAGTSDKLPWQHVITFTKQAAKK